MGRSFWALFTTQFLGALNDNVFKNALVILIAYRGVSVWGLDSAQVVALASGLFILPFLLFSPLAGQICDKSDRASLVRLTKFWEIAVMLLAGVGLYLHNFAFLLTVLFLAGVQATFFGPLKYSMLPDMVKPGQLMKANAFVESATFLAILLGTILGGALVTLPSGELYVIAAILLLSVMGLGSGWLVQKVPVGDQQLQLEWNPWPSLVSKYKMLKADPVLLWAVLLISWFWFFGAVVLSVLPVFGKETLKVDESLVTTFLAVFTFGIGAGSFLCGRLSRNHVNLKLLPYGALGMTVFAFDLWISGFNWPFAMPVMMVEPDQLISFKLYFTDWSSWRILVDFFLLALSGGFFVLPLYTLLQQRSHESYRSRVIAALNIVNAFFMVIAAAMIMVLRALKYNDWEIFCALGFLNIIVIAFVQSKSFQHRDLAIKAQQ